MNRDDLYHAAAHVGQDDPDEPAVDDLQIAAAAAAAALGEPSSASDDSDESSSDGDDSSSGAEGMEDSDSDSDGSSSSDGAAAAGVHLQERITLVLTVVGDRVAVELHPHFFLNSRHGSEAALAGGEAEAPPSSVATSSEEESSSEEEEEGAEEITDYAQLRQIIDAMDDDGEDGGGGGGDVHGRGAAAELFGAIPLPALDVEVLPEDVLTPAGAVLSVIEDTIVVRAVGGSRALNEGTALVLEDRALLGAVEEIFGPVSAPLYALRYAGGAAEPPQGLVPGAVVFSVDRLALYVLPEALTVKGYDADVEVNERGELVEVEEHFSDDEAVSS